MLLVSACVALPGQAGPANESPLLFDQFSHIPCQKELARLDNYAGALRGVPSTVAVIIGYGGRDDTKRGEVAARLGAIRNYLITDGKIDQSRVVTLDGGYREDLIIELWVMPDQSQENAQLLINQTVQPKDVRFKKGKIKKWKYRCKR